MTERLSFIACLAAFGFAMASACDQSARKKSEYPCGEQVAYRVIDAIQYERGDTATTTKDRPDIEAGSVEIDRDVMTIRYTTLDGHAVVLTYDRLDADEVPDSDSGGSR